VNYSIGKNYLFLRDYDNAMEHFKLINEKQYYSEAFWEVRNVWLQDNLARVIIAAVVFATLLAVVRRVDKKKGILEPLRKQKRKLLSFKLLKDVVFMFEFIAHPIDSFYELKRGRKGSLMGATIVNAILVAVFLWFTYGKGYIFQTVRPQNIDIVPVVIGYVSIFVLFITCNYLVTSINNGTGSVKDIYKMVAYSMTPVIIGIVVTTLLSFVLTFNELFLLNFLFTGSIICMLVYLLLGVQETHGYRTRDAFGSLIMTVLFILIIVLVLLIIVMMSTQLYDFVIQIVKEVWRLVT